MLTQNEKFRVVLNLGIELSSINDLDILMEKILTESRRFINADAGSIYLRKGSELLFKYTQNETLQSRLAKNEELIYSTFRIPIDTNTIAGYSAFHKRVINIPDVYDLSRNSEFSFNCKFDEISKYRTHSMICIPLKNNMDDILGILQIINKIDENGEIAKFNSEDAFVLKHFASIASMALERAQMTRQILLRMIKMAELRDPKETGTHVIRVGAFSVLLYEKWAEKQGLERKEIDRNRDIFRIGAMLHDAGKVGISDNILKKPGRFTEEEYDIMKQHTIYGARLFQDRQSEFDDAAFQVALNHHENWDGSGYPGFVNLRTGDPILNYTLENGKPRGKKGKEIPLYGRIVSIADCFDALSSKRIYKEAWKEEDVLNELKKDSGTKFDPELVNLFIENISAIRAIQERYKNEG